MEYGFRCEFCAQPIPTLEYLQLSRNKEYQHRAYIVHLNCDDPDGDEILEVLETCGELRLVRVDE
jgi:hypothetical protein